MVVKFGWKIPSLGSTNDPHISVLCFLVILWLLPAATHLYLNSCCLWQIHDVNETYWFLFKSLSRLCVRGTRVMFRCDKGIRTAHTIPVDMISSHTVKQNRHPQYTYIPPGRSHISQLNLLFSRTSGILDFNIGLWRIGCINFGWKVDFF